MPLNEQSKDKNIPAIVGENTFGKSESKIGVGSLPENSAGILGKSWTDVGVKGWSANGDGIQGITVANTKNGIFGRNTSAKLAPTGPNEPPQGNGVFGYTDVPNASGVCGAVGPNNTDGAGITGIGKTAGRFYGDVEFTGKIHHFGSFEAMEDINVHGNINLVNKGISDIIFSDCAEDFEISETEKIEPGSVMVINQDGVLQQSYQAYDKRVAGVISGAGNLRPGIILGKHQSQNNRMPVALVGKVYCKVDAQYSPIEVGDLLTTSPTPGHAMKADDPLNSFGSVIGKALRPLPAGKGFIPILIALQ